jgi:hypothetical protein
MKSVPNESVGSESEEALSSMNKQQFSAKPAVFISHRGEDIALAERLATQLKQFGFEVWLDKWDISIGDSIVGKINAGLENARYL